MALDSESSVLQLPGVLDFVRYSATYCAMVEPWTTPEWSRSTIEECCPLLANIYAAGWALPVLQDDFFRTLEHKVTEETYDAVRQRIEQVLGENDRFLNAQMQDMKYSDQPVSVSTAEIMADLYQALGDFVWVMRGMNPKNMYFAVAEIRQSMMERWGTLLLAGLRQLHDLLNDPLFDVLTPDDVME